MSDLLEIQELIKLPNIFNDILVHIDLIHKLKNIHYELTKAKLENNWPDNMDRLTMIWAFKETLPSNSEEQKAYHREAISMVRFLLRKIIYHTCREGYGLSLLKNKVPRDNLKPRLARKLIRHIIRMENKYN